MDGDARRILVAMAAAMAVIIGYQFLAQKFDPPPPPPPITTPAAPAPTIAPPGVSGPAPTDIGPTTGAATTPAQAYAFSMGADVGPIPLGGAEGDAFRIQLSPRGAALATLEFFAKDKDGHYVHRSELDVEEPYQVLTPVDDGQRDQYSFATYRIWIEEPNNQSWRLDDVPWTVTEQSPHKVVFTTALRSQQGDQELLRLTKTYELRSDKPILDLDLSIENTSPAPLKIRVEQDGPIGIRKEHLQYDMRRLLTAQESEGRVELGKGYQHSKLKSATRDGEPIPLLNPERGPFLWTALCNKYFGVYTRPLPVTGKYEDYIVGASGLVAFPGVAENQNPGDLLARLVTRPVELQSGGAVDYPFEIYAGPKDAKHLAKLGDEYADPTRLYYQAAQSADARCCCTFDWLRDFMVWLLDKIYYAVQNYGIAIIVLVIIVRGLLHPLTVFQQKSMFRMQDTMGRIQPRMNAIKEKYANDKTRQNQEMMKIWGEEGVNPLGNFVSFIPLFLQMPILIALWTALNTHVSLRHAPFDPWWIVDLSAPDAFWAFVPPIKVPILGDLPLLNRVFGEIASINLLPIIMGVSMWLQQKYMPKPHMKAKLEAAKKDRAEGKPARGMSPEDQMRQQQIMMYMMAIVFPLMFYRMPAGLNLYWLATNVFGIFESLLIRKQLDAEKKRREEEGPLPPRSKKPGLMSRFFKHIAAQTEGLQKKADQFGKETKKKDRDKKKKKP